MKSTKKSLLLSTLSLIMCVAMLLGTTYAWFTDSVTSGKNIITAGNLDIEMYYADGTKNPASVTWADASDATIFNYELWEPGYTEVKHIKIANVGSLALKYQLAIVADGDLGILADVLDVYAFPTATQVATRDALTDTYKIGTLSQVLANASLDLTGNLMPAGTEEKTSENTLTIAVKMQETAGNEYQGLSVANGFTVVLYATQYTYEEDSFNNQYDGASAFLSKDADGNTLISSYADLLYFAKSVNVDKKTYTGETVKLSNNIDIGGRAWTPIGALNASDCGGDPSFNGTFDGNGKTISNLLISKNYANKNGVGFFASNAVYDDIVIKNLTIDNATVYGNKWVGVISGYMNGASIKGCTVTNTTVYCTEKRAGAIVGFASNDAVINGNTADNVKVYVGAKVSETNNVCVGTYTGSNAAANISTNTATNSKVLVPKTITVNVAQGADQDAVDTAVNEKFAEAESGNTIVLPETDKVITLPAKVAQVDVTVKGAGMDKTMVKHNAVQGLPGAELAISDVTLVGGPKGSNYIGFQHTDTEYYENCKFTGLAFFYGNKVVCKNCVFEQSDYEYCFWTYGAADVTFENCTFVTKGKAAKVYNEAGTGTYNITFNNCHFNIVEGYNNTGDKPAVAIASCGAKFNVTMTGCDQTGYKSKQDTALNDWYTNANVPEDVAYFFGCECKTNATVTPATTGKLSDMTVVFNGTTYSCPAN